MRYILAILIYFFICCALASDKKPCTTEKCKPSYTLAEIELLLNQHTNTLSPDVIKTTMATLNCTIKSGLQFNPALTIIDYSLPSTKKRFWVFDLKEKKLLHHTYVAHGINTGQLESDYFSNINNSKANSLGVYITDFSYIGRYGRALKLKGLEKNFNDNAYRRFIVMHPAWYVNEDFIKKYGRIGRTWGCPAIPEDIIEPVVEKIKDKSLLVIYYPETKWLTKSKFLTCDKIALASKIHNLDMTPKEIISQPRGPVLFVDKNNNNKFNLLESVVVISADNYQRIFKKPAPLNRMLRRQINKQEYIALNQQELKYFDSNKDGKITQQDKDSLNVIRFVYAKVKNVRGFNATEFHDAAFGKPKTIDLSNGKPEIITKKSKITLQSTEKFIRWLGL